MIDRPLIVDGPAPGLLPACPLPGRDREERPLYVLQATLAFRSAKGWLRVPRGYVTDFASIPAWASLLTGLRLQALGRWAWAAVAHDWLYAIGEPGRRLTADQVLRERMQLDGVGPVARTIIYRAVRIGGQGGYDEARGWWETQNFADPDSGAARPAPFARAAAFVGGPWGLRPEPDWPGVVVA